MSFRPVQTALLHFLVLLLILATGAHLYAQAPSGGLSGVVTDPSGGVIAKATVRVVGRWTPPRTGTGSTNSRASRQVPTR